MLAPEVPEAPVAPAIQHKKLVYLAYTYHGVPHYVPILKKELSDYLVFNPLGGVEEQFDPEHRDSLLALSCRAPESVIKLCKFPENISKKINDPEVLQTLRAGDKRSEVDSMIFKELFFLARSSVVICDLVMEPYGCELYQKLFYAKILGIPVIGISPMGKSVGAYTQKFLKVLLTDEFNMENLVPLIKAYAS